MGLMYFTFKATGKPVLLLLHGFLGNNNQWDVMVPHFHKFDLLLVELPGHGSSPNCDAYTIDELAIDIYRIMHSIKVDKIHFVGHSMGGYVGCAFAKAYPQNLHSLTLINSIAGADPIARKQLRNRAIQLIDRFQDTYVSMAIANLFTVSEHQNYATEIELMKKQAREINLTSVLAALRAMRDRSSQIDALLEVDVPISYIYGDQDTVIDPELIEKEISKLKVTAHKITAGHMLLITHPMKIIEKVHFID